MKVNGAVHITVHSHYHRRTADIHAIVSDDLQEDMLLSWHDLIKLNVIDESFPYRDQHARAATTTNGTPPEAARRLDQLKAEYADILGD